MIRMIVVMMRVMMVLVMIVMIWLEQWSNFWNNALVMSFCREPLLSMFFPMVLMMGKVMTAVMMTMMMVTMIMNINKPWVGELPLVVPSVPTGLDLHSALTPVFEDFEETDTLPEWWSLKSIQPEWWSLKSILTCLLWPLLLITWLCLPGFRLLLQQDQIMIK